MKVTIIGFGEAGPVFGTALKGAGYQVTAYDRLQADPRHAEQQIEKTRVLDIHPADTLPEAVASADLIVSTVTASEAINAAQQALPGLCAGSHWLDLNSVSPATKQQVYQIVAGAEVNFTEAVAMDTVPAKGVQVPILMCGMQADDLSRQLNGIGLNTRSLGSELGRASSTKMLRSVLIKGMETLFAEAMEAAGQCGVAEQVMDSLSATYPDLDWQEVAGYQLSRASIHAARRAAEMRESASLVESLGVQPLLATAIALKQQELADRSIASDYKHQSVPTVSDFIDAVAHNAAKAQTK